MFVAIVPVIGFILGILVTSSTPATEVDDPCIIFPNGTTAGASDDIVPNASSGNSMMSLELINLSLLDYESGS